MTAKTALITGASSGIGRHTAIALSKAGWNVVITARRQEALEETRDLCANSAACLLVAGDITQEGFVVGLFSQSIAKFGRLDLLFNNAGMSSPQKPIEEWTLDTFRKVVDVNLTAAFICTREAVRQFKKQSPQGGRIINNGSLSAHVPRPFSYAYTMSKHAIYGLTKCTSLDGRSHNIACTQIDIGNTATDMASRLGQGALQPDGRIVAEPMIDVEHVANMVVHVAGLPLDVTVLELNIMPTTVPYVGRG
ncbi:hypothetical protein D9758_007119 [Tetrapyrgos nigripes]|uniref:Uncharacterized protein n=1 Tax=Tetrapyrgos nigripes TaxID=182062 RepID=A0A8H5GDH1_9AGAR|nr:hypothetical protein D9758_007119 [Tetrapyrgos nigripes]